MCKHNDNEEFLRLLNKEIENGVRQDSYPKIFYVGNKENYNMNDVNN